MHKKNFGTKVKFLGGGTILTLLVLLFFEATQPPQTFRETKKILTDIWRSKDFTTEFYCKAPFQITDNGIKVIQSAQYTPRKALTKKQTINERTQNIEFEHIMPAHNFGRHLPCWQKGGRKACHNDKTFNLMEADPRNLVPAIGEINADRSNFRYAEAPKSIVYNQYGNCRVYTDFKAKRFYPAHYSKGLIARTYLYMSETYNIRLSDQERKLMEAWDKTYPKDEYEEARDNAIAQIPLWKVFYKVQNLFAKI
ncbi:endonuclease [Helicobacter trogontum]|uniref:Endonuclease I family protein n=1 Tax=Helicobacter trogontum TaxID=50960 RepID=A0ABQ0D2W5_9HELI|nr:endonuclease [Helicobacter trogontum]MCI5786916.1 endonuclease [Helicobacter trogontum]MDY5185661.1 endonuclease [Helicobacter trogontum]